MQLMQVGGSATASLQFNFPIRFSSSTQDMPFPTGGLYAVPYTAAPHSLVAPPNVANICKVRKPSVVAAQAIPRIQSHTHLPCFVFGLLKFAKSASRFLFPYFGFLCDFRSPYDRAPSPYTPRVLMQSMCPILPNALGFHKVRKFPISAGLLSIPASGLLKFRANPVPQISGAGVGEPVGVVAFVSAALWRRMVLVWRWSCMVLWHVIGDVSGLFHSALARALQAYTGR